MDEVEMYDMGFEDSLARLQPQFDGDSEYMQGYNDAQEIHDYRLQKEVGDE